MRGLGRANF